VATRVLAAETTLTTELAVREDQDSATAADQVAEIDAELRQHGSRRQRRSRCETAGCRI
jgi:hypothetical protein